MIQEAIKKLSSRVDLTVEEAESSMDDIMSGRASDAQIGGFLMALRVKGETNDEISGCARVMREKATAIPTRSPLVVDTCGTGGDGQNTFNVSTTAALIAAGAGVQIAKHGNRSVSSRCGSADVLEALGLPLDLTPEQVAGCIDDIGFGFLFAPSLHRAMKHAGGPRRELGVRTIFNLLGPLTNPARAQAQVMGVFDPDLTEQLAHVLQALGSSHAMVVSGLEGLDELSTMGPTRVSELRNGTVRTYHITPEDLGIEPTGVGAIRGGDATYNAGITRSVLSGRDGPYRDSAVLNAAAALVVADVAEDLHEGIAMAQRSIDSGAAIAKLDDLVNYTRRLAPTG